MSSRRWIEFAETFRVQSDLAKQTLHLPIKTHAKLRRNFGIILNCPGELIVSFRVKRDFHRPAILRARASDSSSGTPLTLPDSISAMRRSISFFQDFSASGSMPP